MWVELRIHSPCAGLPNSGRCLHHLLIAVYLKQRPPSSPLCVEIKSAFFATAVVSHSLHYSLSFTTTSPLPISLESPSILEVYWSVTVS